ncbi:hypothetical protein L2E82_14762 [Cichorium intybus]|uniref:Uncharacterized protein n=1 Tax=Cichorium intybus TaxID=13427 RepID=A0ACB9F1T3_CICIN|nr:hypothetical protein L2E82_14762 [Cichorium intybus]
MYETESSTTTMGNVYFLSLKEVFHLEFLTLYLVHPRYYTELQDSDFCFVKTGEMETSSMNSEEETSISCFNPSYLCVFQKPALNSTNKELKGMMKTVKIQDIDNLQDEMMDMMDISNEIQDSLGRSYSVPDDIDEDKLMGSKMGQEGESDALEVDMGQEGESEGAVDEFGFHAVPNASLRS